MVWGLEYYVSRSPKQTDSDRTIFIVHGSHVVTWAGRCGVRTLINDHIIKEFYAIATQGGAHEGQKFMKATGYKSDPLLGFVKRRKKHNRRL